MKRRILALLAALVLAAPAALAEPVDRWDRARDPEAEARERTLADALALIEQAISATRNRAARKDLLRSARSLLDGIDAEHSPDVRFRFALGEAVHRLDDDARTISVLAPAVDLAPEHPETTHALLSLAIAYARSNRPADEIHAYDRLLPNAGDRRVLVLGNRAEAKLRVEDFSGAIADYQTAIRLAPNEPGALWGLALALDRTGDFSRALAITKEAHDVDDPRRPYLENENVFFVPPYEKEWYLALEQAMLGAQTDRALADRRDSWLEAKLHWEAFLARASKDERWVPLARARRKACDAAIARIDRELKNAPRPRPRAPDVRAPPR